MNVEEWQIFYKYQNRGMVRPNIVYVPRISPDKKIFCMHYNFDRRYFYDRVGYTQAHIDFFFENECKWLEHIQNEKYAPEIIDIDKNKQQIFFKWYDSSLNHLIEFAKWKNEYTDKVNDVLNSLEDSNIIKMNFYPHNTYLDDNDNIRVHDFYACASLNSPYIPMDKIEVILGNINKFYYEKHTTEGLVNLKNMYIEVIKNNRGEWPVCLATNLQTY